MKSAAAKLVLGARGSPLALRQAEIARAALIAADPSLEEPGAVAIEVIETKGDAIQDRPLAEIGGKGLFTKEIQEALLDRRIDIAVHSLKDVATRLPEGTALDGRLPRDDPRDAFIAKDGARFEDLPRGARLGTSSLRRRAQLLARRPDLRCVDFRGNVQTRLRKLEDGLADATILARAGLDRLDNAKVASETLDPDTLLPAVAQGVIGLERRANDSRAEALLAAIDDPASARCSEAERAALRALDGDCRTPIAAFAELDGDAMFLRLVVAKPDGTRVLRAERRGAAADARRLGEDAARELAPDIGPDFFFVADGD